MNFPRSMLAWDVLALNVLIPFYILYSHFRGKRPDKLKYLSFVYLSVFGAVNIHMVTAFLYAGLPARPL
jgi:molybdopterin-containing oxidoreductase family membrane subunit